MRRPDVRVSIKALAMLEQYADPEDVARIRRSAYQSRTAVSRGISAGVSAAIREQIRNEQIRQAFLEDTRRGGGGGGSRSGKGNRRANALKQKIIRYAIRQRIGGAFE